MFTSFRPADRAAPTGGPFPTPCVAGSRIVVDTTDRRVPPRPPEWRCKSVGMSYRVVQWATGNQGVEAIRAVLDRPDMKLVGAKVYSADKAGGDAGVLAGRERCGVVATLDVDEILALGAHCVAYFPRLASLDE